MKLRQTLMVALCGSMMLSANSAHARKKAKAPRKSPTAAEWKLPYDLPPKRPWQAKPADKNAPLKNYSCPIIDFGDDLVNTGNFPGLRGGNTKNEIWNLDFDGDGKNNDSVVFYEFSMDKPLNQLPDTYRIYEANNSIFYGGGVGYFYNKNPRFSENCINTDYQNLFDDISFNSYAAGKGEKMRVFVTYLWKKEDFLNGGDSNKVTFDENSEMHTRISRYWKSYTEGRFVIKNGEQFYISEYDFDIQPSSKRSGAPNCQKLHSIKPTTMKWAKWNPKPPYDLEYKPEELKFETIKFDDINVVGWMAAKTDITPGACWLKWGGFEVKGTVTRKWRPSEAINMVKPKGEKFYIGQTEINYETWRRIYKWVARPQWGSTPSYVFDQNGDMGSIKVGNTNHTAQEPATCMTWYDAVAWCNALSHFEGKKPAYYADAAKTKVLHVIKERQDPTNLDWQPKVYIDWEANGYRLPTASEWKASFGSEKLEQSEGQNNRTVKVGNGKPNANNIYDMHGNVWEFIWDAGDVFDPATQKTHTVLGGGFRYPADVAKIPASKYGEIPSLGSYNIGFRVIRYDEKGEKPTLTPVKTTSGYVDGKIPEWTIAMGEKILPAKEIKPVLSVELKPEMKKISAGSLSTGKIRKLHVTTLPFEIASKEVSYKLWNEVYNWAIMNDYKFNHDGDMGSMSFQYGNFEFTPEEPVTTIGFFDTLLWLNAYSEIEGKTPMYYSDKEKTKVLKLSNMFRGSMLVTPDQNRIHSGVAKLANHGYVPTYAYVKWEADGYRLPIETEWEYAAYAGTEKYITKDPKKGDKNIWGWDNTGGRTMPVGVSTPNEWGIYDMIGNVYEFTWASNTKNKLDIDNPRHDFSIASAKGGAYSVRKIESGKRGNKKYYPNTKFAGGAKSVLAYPEFGFRIARAEAGVQPAEKDMSEKIIWDVDIATIDPLQGTMYRGNNNRSANYPTSGVPSLKGLKWKFSTTKPIDSSPTIVGDTVYVGCDDGNMYALNKNDGSIKWKFATKGNKAIKSTPAVWKNKVVCFVGNDGFLYALDAKSGEKKWQAESRFHRSKEYPSGTSPLILKDYVFCNGKETKIAFDIETGKKVWENLGGRNAGSMGSFTYSQGRIYNCMGSGGSGAIDLKTARNRDMLNNCGGDTLQVTAASDGKMMFTADGDGMVGYKVNVNVTEKGKNGKLKKSVSRAFQYQEKHWNKLHPHFSAMAVDNVNLYAGNLDKYVYAVNKKSGKLSWKFKTGSDVYSGPSVAKGIVYFGSMDGHIYAVDAKSGTEKWKYKTDGKITWSSPTPTNGALYIGGSDGLYVLE